MATSLYVTHFLHFFVDRNLWYTFFWLATAFGVPIRRLPLAWRMATAAAVIAAFVLDIYYSGYPGTIARTMFSVCGTLLSASAAILLFENRGPQLTRTCGMGARIRKFERGMVRPRRFELLTYSFGGCRSIQLSYGRVT